MKNKVNINYIFLVILISISIGCLFNILTDKGIPFIKKEIELRPLDNTSNITNEISEPKSISIEQTFDFFKSKKNIFIDARDQWEFAEGHIQGAINIPQYKFVVSDLDNFNFSKTDTLVIYCDGNDCDTSKKLAQELSKLGYKYLFVYLGGYYEWLNLDLPIER